MQRIHASLKRIVESVSRELVETVFVSFTSTVATSKQDAAKRSQQRRIQGGEAQIPLTPEETRRKVCHPTQFCAENTRTCTWSFPVKVEVGPDNRPFEQNTDRPVCFS